METDAWNNYIDQLDYATAFANVVKTSADIAGVYVAGPAYKGVMALEQAIISGDTVRRMIKGQLSTKEAIVEAGKLTTGLFTGQIGGVVGTALQAGGNLVLDAAAGSGYVVKTAKGFLQGIQSYLNDEQDGGWGWRLVIFMMNGMALLVKPIKTGYTVVR